MRPLLLIVLLVASLTLQGGLRWAGPDLQPLKKGPAALTHLFPDAHLAAPALRLGAPPAPLVRGGPLCATLAAPPRVIAPPLTLDVLLPFECQAGTIAASLSTRATRAPPRWS